MERCVCPCVDRTNVRRGQRPTSDVFPQTLRSFQDGVSLWTLVLTASVALLPTKPQGPSCFHPMQARELQTQSTHSPFLHGWQEPYELGNPHTFHWDVIQGSDCKDILCIPKGCRLPRKPHPSHHSTLYEPTNLYLSLGSVQAQHFLKGFLRSPSEKTLLFFLSTITLGTHFLLCLLTLTYRFLF